MKPIERIELIINRLSIPISEFERVIGVSNNSIGAAIRRKTSIKDETINSILKAYPKLNSRWLLLGEGDMERSYENGLSGFEDIELLIYIHENITRFKEIPAFRKLFDAAYLGDYMREIEEIRKESIKAALSSDRKDSQLT